MKNMGKMTSLIVAGRTFRFSSKYKLKKVWKNDIL